MIARFKFYINAQNLSKTIRYCRSSLAIGIYRDVWIAAIASSRTSLATPSVVICNYVTMKITFVTRKFRNGQRNLHRGAVHITTKWVFCITLDYNDVFAIKAYDAHLTSLRIIFTIMLV